MDAVQTLERKALVVKEGSMATGLIIKYYLPRLNCSMTCTEYSAPAAREIKQTQYPLIIMPVKVAPGSIKECPDDLPELAELWNKRGLCNGERYFNQTQQLCRYARQNGSPNKDSLIIVADTYKSQKDSSIPDVERRALEAGADAYLKLSGRDLSMEFFEIVRDKLRW